MIKMIRKNGKPICGCCNDNKYVIHRKGGGFRCERCKTIFDEFGIIVGDQNYGEHCTFDPIRFAEMMKERA